MTISRYTMMILFSILIAVFIVVTHEQTHGTIMRYYGCDDVSYVLKWNYAYTQCDDETHEWSDEETLAHSINEIVGYTVIPMVYLLVVLAYANYGENVRQNRHSLRECHKGYEVRR